MVLFVFDTGGYRPGDFVRVLLDAMVHADPQNLAKLALGYPGYASAVYAAQVDGGLDQLLAIARNRA